MGCPHWHGRSAPRARSTIKSPHSGSKREEPAETDREGHHPLEPLLRYNPIVENYTPHQEISTYRRPETKVLAAYSCYFTSQRGRPQLRTMLITFCAARKRKRDRPRETRTNPYISTLFKTHGAASRRRACLMPSRLIFRSYCNLEETEGSEKDTR